MSDPCKPLLTKKSVKKQRRRKKLGPTNSSVTMDQAIWKELPKDLLEAVIAKLPVASFFQFRLVSREWNSLLVSRSFLEEYARVSKFQPWFHAFLTMYEHERSIINVVV